jgi:stage II sporulation protein P
MVSASGDTYRTVADIDGKKDAQHLIVMGTSEGGLSHTKWKENLTLAVHLQKQVCDEHPLLMRPINLRAERFNQHASKGSMLIEMGTSSNTLQEALYAAELFTSSFCNMLDSLKA